MSKARRMQLWEASRAAIPPALEPAKGLFAGQAARYLQQYARTGNGAHLWRAWRIARLLPQMPPELERALFSHIDLVALDMCRAASTSDVVFAARMHGDGAGARGSANKAVANQQADIDLFTRFYDLLAQPVAPGEQQSRASVLRQLALDEDPGLSGDALKLRADAIKKRLQRIERRGQYATRSRR